jgi:hypothetical protein
MKLPIDPNVFGDPLACQPQWSHANPTSRRVWPYKLVRISPDRLAFRPGLAIVVFMTLFILTGLFILVALPLAAMTGHFDGAWWQAALITLTFPLAFGGVGVWGLIHAYCPRFFDLEKGWYWASRKPVGVLDAAGSNQHGTPLKEIYALQIIGFSHPGGYRGGGRSYELNLVLSNADRIHVVDHSALKRLRRDATRLAELLNVPLWDATDTSLAL